MEKAKLRGIVIAALVGALAFSLFGKFGLIVVALYYVLKYL